MKMRNDTDTNETHRNEWIYLYKKYIWRRRKQRQLAGWWQFDGSSSNSNTDTHTHKTVIFASPLLFISMPFSVVSRIQSFQFFIWAVFHDPLNRKAMRCDRAHTHRAVKIGYTLAKWKFNNHFYTLACVCVCVDLDKAADTDELQTMHSHIQYSYTRWTWPTVLVLCEWMMSFMQKRDSQELNPLLILVTPHNYVR